MSTALSEPAAVEEHVDPSVADVGLLEDKLPDWFRLPKYAAGFALVVSLVYWFYALLPIWHTDVWGHLSYGRLLWASKTLPQTEPLMPLSQGIPFTDTAWLTQLIGYAAHEFAGRAALKFLFGISVATCAGLMLWRAFERTRNGLISALAIVLFLWVDYQQLRIMRPQLAGLVLFCGLLFLLHRRSWSKVTWYLVSAGFALWANLHGSFAVGLGLLACYTVGRAIDVLRRTRSLKAVVHDTRMRRYFLLTELAAIATLINPYGLSLYTAVMNAAANSNMEAVVEWQPLTLRHAQGQAAAAVALLLIFLYRVSPRRVRTAEVLTVFGLGLASLWSSRFLNWWSPVVALSAALHSAAAWRNWRRARCDDAPVSRASLWTVASIGIMWVAFAWSPLGMVVVRKLVGSPVNAKTKFVSATSEFTPEALTEYLQKNPPKGQIFNPYEWGDYLLWAGPQDMKIFVASHVHLIPTEVWEDYVGTVTMQSGWEKNFDRYGINTVVLDDEFRGALIRQMFENDEWKLEYRDTQGAVFTRKKPI